MSLPERIAAILEREGVAFAVIGAAAMALHGVSRATADFDLGCADPARVLVPSLWHELGVEVEVRRGDPGDPLAGVVRFDEAVDLVVFGPLGWQREVIERAVPLPGSRLPVVRPADLLLLKLYAAGPQDGWDVAAMLSARDDADALIAEVTAASDRLPARGRRMWARVLEDRSAPE